MDYRHTHLKLEIFYKLFWLLNSTQYRTKCNNNIKLIYTRIFTQFKKKITYLVQDRYFTIKYRPTLIKFISQKKIFKFITECNHKKITL